MILYGSTSMHDAEGICNRSRVPRVNDTYASRFEVGDGSGNNRHPVNNGRGSDQSLLIERLIRLKHKCVNGAVKVSSTNDFALVVDARGHQQRPAGIGRDELVQIDDFAVLPEERPQLVIIR
jgi:hypothetical protein